MDRGSRAEAEPTALGVAPERTAVSWGVSSLGMSYVLAQTVTAATTTPRGPGVSVQNQFNLTAYAALIAITILFALIVLYRQGRA